MSFQHPLVIDNVVGDNDKLVDASVANSSLTFLQMLVRLVKIQTELGEFLVPCTGNLNHKDIEVDYMLGPRSDGGDSLLDTVMKKNNLGFGGSELGVVPFEIFVPEEDDHNDYGSALKTAYPISTSSHDPHVKHINSKEYRLPLTYKGLKTLTDALNATGKLNICREKVDSDEIVGAEEFGHFLDYFALTELKTEDDIEKFKATSPHLQDSNISPSTNTTPDNQARQVIHKKLNNDTVVGVEFVMGGHRSNLSIVTTELGHFQQILHSSDARQHKFPSLPLESPIFDKPLRVKVFTPTKTNTVGGRKTFSENFIEKMQQISKDATNSAQQESKGCFSNLMGRFGVGKAMDIINNHNNADNSLLISLDKNNDNKMLALKRDLAESVVNILLDSPAGKAKLDSYNINSLTVPTSKPRIIQQLIGENNKDIMTAWHPIIPQATQTQGKSNKRTTGMPLFMNLDLHLATTLCVSCSGASSLAAFYRSSSTTFSHTQLTGLCTPIHSQQWIIKNIIVPANAITKEFASQLRKTNHFKKPGHQLQIKGLIRHTLHKNLLDQVTHFGPNPCFDKETHECSDKILARLNNYNSVSVIGLLFNLLASKLIHHMKQSNENAVEILGNLPRILDKKDTKFVRNQQNYFSLFKCLSFLLKLNNSALVFYILDCLFAKHRLPTTKTQTKKLLRNFVCCLPIHFQQNVLWIKHFKENLQSQIQS